MRIWRIAGIVLMLIGAGFAILLLLETIDGGSNAELQALSQVFTLSALAFFVADARTSRARSSD
jgi:hypothetical protein